MSTPTNSNLPAEFIEFWKALCEEFPRRERKVAWRILLADWLNGGEIIGYSKSPDANPSTGIPHGWSYNNLVRYV